MSYHHLEITCTFLLLIYPIFLFGLRFFRRRWMPWWLLALLMSGIGWGLLNGAAHYNRLILDEQMQAAGPNPPEELALKWKANQGRRTVASVYGWAYGLGYALLFLPPYAIGTHLRRRFKDGTEAKG